MKNFFVLLKRARTEILEGGWPVAKRKIRAIPARAASWNPILYGVYLVLLLVRYIAKTSMRRYSAMNLGRFGTEFFDLIQKSTTDQSNKTKILLMEADGLIATANLNSAMALYQKAVCIDPHQPEIYFKIASAFYLQGKYHNFVPTYETGLKLQQEKSVEQGLNLFGVKLIGESWGGNIGHESHLDPLVKLAVLGLLSPHKRIVFMRPESVANLCYLNYWRRYLDIIFLDDRTYRFLLESFGYSITEHVSMFQLKEGFLNFYSAWNLAENRWRSENRPPLLELSEIDRERGNEVLKQWSVPSQSWFVCLHVREGDSRTTHSGPDSEILSYIPAINAITSRGGWVIRMGHPGMEALPSLPRVIDYANTEYKSDWMDVFLWASCKFLIGTSSGPLSVPPTFGKPVLYTNACAIGINANIPNSLIVPKLFWTREEERFFTFQEMLDGPMGWTVSRVFHGIDCALIDNTSEEIESAVIEMLDNLEKGCGKERDLSDLQKRFNCLRKQYGDTGQMTISETFAQRHSDLL